MSVFIKAGENTPPPPGEKISANVFWGEKYEKVKSKRGQFKRKGKEKGRKGKENEKRGSKRVK